MMAANAVVVGFSKPSSANANASGASKCAPTNRTRTRSIPIHTCGAYPSLPLTALITVGKRSTLNPNAIRRAHSAHGACSVSAADTRDQRTIRAQPAIVNAWSHRCANPSIDPAVHRPWRVAHATNIYRTDLLEIAWLLGGKFLLKFRRGGPEYGRRGGERMNTNAMLGAPALLLCTMVVTACNGSGGGSGGGNGGGSGDGAPSGSFTQ